MRCAVQNSKLWVCIIGYLSVFLPKQSSRLTAQSDSRALHFLALMLIKSPTGSSTRTTYIKRYCISSLKNHIIFQIY